MKHIIAIAGNARSGKDTLADNMVDIFSSLKIKSEKYSFAKALKQECNAFTKKTLGISAFTEDSKEKEIIRPLLVTWGTHVRRKLDPDVWVKSVDKKLSGNKISIISDVRFENEYEWVRENKGMLIFVDRILPCGSLVPPANDEELANNDFLKRNADFHLCWATTDNTEQLNALSYEAIMQAVPEKTIQQWTQTCR